MMTASSNVKEMPLNIVGGTHFAIHEKISTEETINMMVSDGAMIPFAGYSLNASTTSGGKGRRSYSSVKGGFVLSVIGNGIFVTFPNGGVTQVGKTIGNISTQISIAENNAAQIAICDQENIYVWDYRVTAFNTLTPADLGFTPTYITAQNGYIIYGQINSNVWGLSQLNNALDYTNLNGQFQSGTLASNVDLVVAPKAFGSLLLVFGISKGEMWYISQYAQLFPYIRNNWQQIAYGLASEQSYAANEEIACWLGQNKESQVAIMYTKGGLVQSVENDGIAFKLSKLTNIKNTTGSVITINNHLLYIITAPDDNFTYAYDFNENKFYTLTDNYGNYFVAQNIVCLNNKFYFTSLNDSNIYNLTLNNFTFNGLEIPRIRTPPPFRLPNSSRFVANYVDITMEMGDSKEIRRVDMSISINGGTTYSNTVSQYLRPLPIRQNKFKEWGLGASNDLRTQFRFWGKDKFVITTGVIGVYQ